MRSTTVILVPNADHPHPLSNAIQVLRVDDPYEEDVQWVICGNGEYDVACATTAQLRELARSILEMLGGS